MSTSVSAWPLREYQAGIPITADSFTHLFPNVVESIEQSGENDMVVTFEGVLTANQQYQARRFIRTTPEMENLEKQGVSAYQALQDYRNLTTPTNTQTIAQIKLQAQLLQGLLKLTFPDAARELLGGL